VGIFGLNLRKKVNQVVGDATRQRALSLPKIQNKIVSPTPIKTQPMGNFSVGAPKPVVTQPRPASTFNQPQTVRPQLNVPITNPVQLPTISPTTRPNNIATVSNEQTITSHAGPATREDYANDWLGRTITGLSHGVGRSVVGTAQSLSGLYDTLTPGKGQNRLTHKLNATAENIDQRTRELGLNQVGYKIGQAGTDIATFLAPGVLAPKVIVKGGELASKIPKVSGAVSKITKGAKALQESGKTGRIVVGAGKYVTRPSVIANVGVDTGLGTGYRAARGQKITPGTIGTDFGTSLGMQGALTLSGKGIKSGVNYLGDKLISDDILKPKNLSLDTSAISPSEAPKTPQVGKTEPGRVVVKPSLKDTGIAVTPKTRTFDDAVNDIAQEVANKEAQVMKYKGLEKIRVLGRNISKSIYNPLSEVDRLDTLAAKKLGIKNKDIKAADRLTAAVDQVRASGGQARIMMGDSGIDKVIQKYKPGTDSEKKFITYMTMVRDKNVRTKKGVKLTNNTDDELTKFIGEYEVANPNARTDMKIVNDHFENLANFAKDKGLITQADFDAARATEDFYAPIARVIGSEDVPRPRVDANPQGSLGKQHVLQSLSGSADPINQTWDAIIKNTVRTVREANVNSGATRALSIAEQGLVDNMVRMGRSPEQSRAIIEANRIIEELQSNIVGVQKGVKVHQERVVRLVRN
jgi:hypothetical protein